jgi:hypothetical protein
MYEIFRVLCAKLLAKNPKNLSCKTINLNFSIKDHTSEIPTDKTSALRIYAQLGKILSGGEFGRKYLKSFF